MDHSGKPATFQATLHQSRSHSSLWTVLSYFAEEKIKAQSGWVITTQSHRDDTGWPRTIAVSPEPGLLFLCVYLFF